jgi:hypothetical protein
MVNGDGSITVPLSRKVTSVDQELAEVVMREPTGLDLRSAGDPAGDGYTHRLIARCCNITPSAVDQMAGRDVQVLGRVLNVFLAASAQQQSLIDTLSLPAGGVTSGTSLT